MRDAENVHTCLAQSLEEVLVRFTDRDLLDGEVTQGIAIEHMLWTCQQCALVSSNEPRTWHKYTLPFAPIPNFSSSWKNVLK